MRIKSRKSKHIPTQSVLSRNELSSIMSVADALERAAPSNVRLSDSIKFTGSEFDLIWVDKNGGNELNSTLTEHVDGKINEALNQFVSRRMSARKAGLAIQELPSDSKQLSLNKAVNEAERNELVLVRHGVGEKDVAVKSEDPRSVLLVKPQDEPLRFQSDYLVSGSNVVGGPTQLPLFQDAIVDVIYFLHEAPYAQIRAKVPLHLAAVVNLKTRIRGEFIRTHPEDSHIVTVNQPEVYVPDD